MADLVVAHHVADFDRWLEVFRSKDDLRKSNGGTGHSVARVADDPNSVVVTNSFATLDGARAFAANPALKEAMAEAGVDSEPQVWIVEEVEALTY
jgi:heme-degrading monooxygenase HmoA